MALQQFTWRDNAAPITSIKIEKGFLRESAATLYLPSPTPDTVENISRLLSEFPKRDIGVYMDMEEDRPVLRLSHFGKPEELLTLLRDHHLIADNAPQVEKLKTRPEKQGMRAFIQRNAMRINSAFSYIGQVGGMLRGVREMNILEQIQKESLELFDSTSPLREEIRANEKKETALQTIIEEFNKTSPTPLINDTSPTLLDLVNRGMTAEEFSSMTQGGRENIEIGLLNILAITPRFIFGAGYDAISFDKVAEEAHRQVSDGQPPRTPWINMEYAYTETLQASAFNLARKYPIQIADGLSMVTSARKMKTGIDLKREGGLREKFVEFNDFLQGLSIFTGSALAVFMPELKKKAKSDTPSAEADAAEPKSGGALNFISAHPLQVQSLLSFFVNINLVRGATQMTDDTRRKYSLVNSLSFVGAKIFNFLASKNGQKPDNLRPFDPLFTRIANMLVESPPEKRKENLDVISGMLSQQIGEQLGVIVDDLTGQIQQRIRDKVAVLEQNPWLQPLRQQAGLTAPGTEDSVKAAEIHAPAAEKPAPEHATKIHRTARPSSLMEQGFAGAVSTSQGSAERII